MRRGIDARFAAMKRATAACATALGMLPALLSVPAIAAESPAPGQSLPQSLPQPLTLAQALALAEGAHPELESARAGIALADADTAFAQSLAGVRAFLELTPQTVQPTNQNSFINDSYARLALSKPLYDFGRAGAQTRAAYAARGAAGERLADTLARRRVTVMSRFFDVVLADLRYAVDNEATASAYVTFDRARERHSLGQLSDIDLLEREHRFQEARSQRAQSAARQRTTRVQLALALNRPDAIPVDVIAPTASPAWTREPPDFGDVWPRVRARHPVLRALRREVDIARETVAAERARRRPILSAEAEAGYYARELVLRNERRATLNLRVPLLQGGEDRAVIARAQAQLHERAARLELAEQEAHAQTWDILQEIEMLRIQREGAKVRSSYRDLYLDRARALYELERQTDLGDAMIRNTEAAWLAAKIDYRLALAWARLAALSGELPGAEVEEP